MDGSGAVYAHKKLYKDKLGIFGYNTLAEMSRDHAHTKNK